MTGSGKKTILLVEDEAIIAMAQKSSLEQNGYFVINVNSGERAISTAENNYDIDLILMDINLGEGINGAEAAAEILKKRSVPIVFLSSHTEPEIVAKTEIITSYGYVVKNSNIAVLLNSLKMAFRLFDAKEALIESEIRQNTMINNISDVICIIDDKFKIKYCSCNIEKWFGWDYSALNGKDFSEIIHADEIQTVKEIFSRMIREGIDTTSNEFRLKCRNGSYKQVQITAANLFSNPALNGLLLNFHDVEDRIHSETEKNEMISKFIAVFNYSPVAFVIYSMDGKVADANESYFKLTGYDRSEIVGNRTVDLELIGREERENLVKAIRPADGSLDNFQVKMKRKDGTFRTVLVSSKIITINGVMHRLGTNIEITELVKAKEKLEIQHAEIEAQNEEFQQLNDELVLANTELESARQKAEESQETYRKLYNSLLESEESLSITLQSIADGVIATDMDGRINRMNKTAEKLTGWNFSEACGKLLPEVFSIFEFSTKKRALNPVAKILETGKAASLSTHTILAGRDGGEYHISDSAAPILDTEGNIRGVILIFSDVTEKYRSEIELRKNENLYRTIFNEINAGIALIDSISGRIYSANAKFSEITGRTLKELENINLISITHPEDVKPELEYMARMTTGEISGFQMEKRFYCKNEKIKWVKMITALLPSPAMAEHHFLCMIEDISGRKAAADELQYKTWKLENIIESTRLGTWEWNVQTGETVFNHVWAEIIGYSLDEISPVNINTWERFAHPDDLKKSGELLEKHFSGETSYYSFESRMKHKNGHWIWVLDRGRVVTWTPDGKPLLMFGTHSEITEQKKEEDKIKTLLEEKEIILREVHHRIKNNMNTMKSLLHLQAMKMQDPVIASILQEAGGRIQSMELLYEKLYKSQDYRNLSAKIFLEELVDQIIANFKIQARVDTVKSITEFSLDLKLLQVIGIIINELISNCMKYAFKGKSSGTITVTVNKNENMLNISIADDGIGIPDTVSFENSSGFGLTLVEALTEQMEGSISIDRTAGTKFEIILKI